jgi:mannose-6-phosphate isomerase-like protein (cupin superfamily)
MKERTLLKRREQMNRKPLPQCHGGEGVLDWTLVLGEEEIKDKRLNFIHDDVIPPGASIGLHQHVDDEEYYYIISGKGLMALDGKKFEVKTGDVMAVFPGGSHGLENDGTEDLRIIVISIS